MIKSNKLLLIFLLLPVFAIAGLAAYKSSALHSGKKIILPIIGYDPRDLLSGHYITYTVDYGVPQLCGTAGAAGFNQTAYVCLDSKSFSYTRPFECSIVIKGVCSHGRFVAGIERFYVPEKDAAALDKLVRAKKAELEISVTSDDTAQVKELLIEGRPWSSWQQASP